MAITVQGRTFTATMPPIVHRRQIVSALRASLDGFSDDRYPALRICAAAVVLCIPEVAFFAKLDKSIALRDLYAFGDAALNVLMDRGWSEVDVIEAVLGHVSDEGDNRTGDDLWIALNDRLWPTQAEVQAAGK